jgi:hypothetical protein
MSGSPVESVLTKMRGALEAACIPYMLTGSFASSLHGMPRVTHDVDIVIAPTIRTLDALIGEFPEDRFYLSRDAALQAYASEGMFNIVDFETGWKIDLIFRKSRPFSVEEFSRRREETLNGLRIFVASPEDVVLSKLEWAKLGESERQIRDVAGILVSRDGELDLNYLERWVAALGLASQWTKAKAAAV